MNRHLHSILFCTVLFTITVIFLTSGLWGVGPNENQHDESPISLFENMGKHGRKITTVSPKTQSLFNQGLTWAYGFNHDEAIRSFLQAAKHDPKCAMTWWAIAYCEGPNYNSPITPERSKSAWYALQNAKARAMNTSDKEKGLIEALATRYAMPAPEDRAELDKAYCLAMQSLWERHPDDADIGTLYAESLMMLRPWKLYTIQGTPEPDTDKIVETLEAVRKIQPDHPGANHLYVHAMEPSLTPHLALEAANALDDLVPASGHLLHMPSHIYVRTGFWDKAVEQNRKAIEADDAYLAISPDQGMQLVYMIHNSHMMAYAAMMCGREQVAMKAARRMWTQTPEPLLIKFGPFLDRWMCSVYDVQKRFGRWDDILNEPAPPKVLPITTTIWRAHRAIAYAAKHDFPNAQKEYTAFRQSREAIPPEAMAAAEMDGRFLQVSDLFIRGEIALQQKNWTKAIEHLQEAAEIESTLDYGEPPQWLQPIRHTLGAVYIASGNFKQAEMCYREDLEKWPANGWSLYGLGLALEKQGKRKESQKFQNQFKQVWSKAEEPIDSSCKCLIN